MADGFLSQLTGSFAIHADGNPTVAMIEAAYRHAGLGWRYLNCEVAPEAIGDAVRGARAMGWQGFNCSLPHKISVMQHLDGLTETAEVMGAVNTVVGRDGLYVGDNTDGKGFVESLRTVIDPVGKAALILGAGGAARAIAIELALSGASWIGIASRTAERGQGLVERIRSSSRACANLIPWQGTLAVPPGVQIVVNATPQGMYPNVGQALDLAIDSLGPSIVVADVILNPLTTRLLHDAERMGCVTLNGIGMLARQGAVIVKAWTGVSIDAAIFTAALLGAMGQSAETESA